MEDTKGNVNEHGGPGPNQVGRPKPLKTLERAREVMLRKSYRIRTKPA